MERVGSHMDSTILVKKSEGVKVNFVSTLQGRFNNAFAALSERSFRIDGMSGKASAFSNEVKIEIENFRNYKFNATVQRVFDIFIVKLSAILPHKKLETDVEYRRFQTVSITLKEYMTLCNLRNSTKAIEQLRNALNIIGRIHVDFMDTVYTSKKKVEKNFCYFQIADNITRDKGKGVYSITFNIGFLRHLANSYIMPFPLHALSIDLKHYPIAYQLCRRLTLHHNMNYFKGNANSISVRALIDSITLLPTHQEILNGDRQIGKRIIKPLEKALDTLVKLGILSGWHYNKQFTKKTYEQWLDSAVVFTFTGFPIRKNNIVSSDSESTKGKQPKR